MPSGAKKRKAAKKKLQQQTHNKDNHIQPQGSDDSRPHDDREIDVGEAKQSASEELAGYNHEQGTNKMTLGEVNNAKITKEVKAEKYFNGIETDDTSRELHHNEDFSKSSSHSSSEEDEVEVEKEKPIVTPNTTLDYVPEMVCGHNLATSDVVDNPVEQSIPIEESVKEVVSLPQDSNHVVEIFFKEYSTTNDAVNSGLMKSVDEVSLSSGMQKQDNNSSVGIDLPQEKTETQVILVDDEGLTTTKDNESLLLESSRGGGNDHEKELDKHSCPDGQPLVSSAPRPVQRTSLMNCCGLYDVLFGGSGR